MFERNLFLIGAGVGLVLLIGATWAARKVVPAAAAAVNPLNPQNVFAQGANATAAAVTGDSFDTLGTAIWKLLNPAQAARERQVTAPSLARSSGNVLYWGDPNDPMSALAAGYTDRPGGGASGGW